MVRTDYGAKSLCTMGTVIKVSNQDGREGGMGTVIKVSNQDGKEGSTGTVKHAGQ